MFKTPEGSAEAITVAVYLLSPLGINKQGSGGYFGFSTGPKLQNFSGAAKNFRRVDLSLFRGGTQLK